MLHGHCFPFLLSRKVPSKTLARTCGCYALFVSWLGSSRILALGFQIKVSKLIVYLPKKRKTINGRQNKTAKTKPLSKEKGP